MANSKLANRQPTRLARELEEELGIQVLESMPLIEISHDYPDRKVRLHVREVDRFDGQPHGNEGQQVEWIGVTDSRSKDFLEAAQPIFHALCLPGEILITDTRRYSPDEILRRIAERASAGEDCIVQVREPLLEGESLGVFVRQVRELTQDSPMQVFFEHKSALRSKY